MRCLVFAMGLLSVAMVTRGGEVLNTLAQHDKSGFRIVISMVIEGNSDEVFSVLTDYQRLAEISDMVVSTGKITKQRSLEDGPVRVRIMTRTCVLFLCFSARIIEDVEIVAEGAIKATIVPELSDFEEGEILIAVQAQTQDHTQVDFDSRFKPKFWVPPFIGPLIIKHKATQSAKNTILHIEKLVDDNE